MNVIGKLLTVMAASDPTLVGKHGLVVLETANTLLLDSAGATVRVPKADATFRLLGASRDLQGSELAGRLQDRLGRRAL